MLSILAKFLLCSLALRTNAMGPDNTRPIIGIVTEEVNSTFDPQATSSMLASYVKFVESGGARVVPIWIRKPVEYYQDIMSKINGVLFPGGGNILASPGYGRTGKIIFDIAKQMNDKGDFFPLWGTCLGFELLNYVAAKKNWMKACAAEDLATTVDFTDGYKEGSIFKFLEDDLEENMPKKKVVIHYHQWCLTPENFTLSGLDKFYRVLAVNRDARNMTFVSVIEAYKYPFYGVSFHPEKVMFEWVMSDTHHNIPHNVLSVRVSQYFANFLADEARKSSHHFPNQEEEDAVLIYNYNPMYIGKYKNNPTQQKYYFTQ